MGVYIPNLKKPVGCIFCPLRMIDHQFNGHEWEDVYICWLTQERTYEAKCPLIELTEREDGLYERVN